MRLNRRILLIATLSAATMAWPALAASIAENVTAQLLEQGYTVTSVERTLLGRTRIVAVKNGQEREIILNGRTGEILRDFLKRDSSDDGEQKILVPRNSGSGSSGSGDDDGTGDDGGTGDNGGNSGSGGGDDDKGDSDTNSGSDGKDGHGGSDDGDDDKSGED